MASPNNLSPQSLRDIVTTFKHNFLTRNVEVVPGLTFNQYEIIKRIYFYSHNQFESGPNDENGEPKYFYDLMTDRNDQATKNIDLDTKDVYIKSETPGSYLKSWLLRREFMAYAKTTGFGMKLNDAADDLPDFGTVVWKKVKNEKGEDDVEQVELINIINDPVAKCLKDGTMIERHLMTQSDLRAKEKVYGKENVDTIIASGKTVSRTQFMTDNGTQTSQYSKTSVDESTPYYEVYEYWGEIPKFIYDSMPSSKEGGESVVKYQGKPVAASKPTSPKVVEHTNETVYVMALVTGVDDGGKETVLFCRETSKDKFPYKEAHMRRRKGRWLGIGNYELCFQLIEKANEVTNRYFSSLRLALLHIYQTRDKSHIKNVLTDLLDGDVIVTKSELTALPTEIRGFTNYKDEIDRIESKADRLCNSFEVVSGADLPSGTPFKLGQQQLTSATKLFKYIQQKFGLFLEDVFNEWLLPSFAKSLTKEHILDLVDDADDLEMYYNARKRIFQYDVLKRYILENNEMPSAEEIASVGNLVKDQIAKGPKQILVEKDYYANQKYSLKTVITGENDTKKENIETLTTTMQTIAANPAVLQDSRFMKLLGIVLEESGFSPLELNMVNQTPTNPSLNPANQGGGGVERSIEGGVATANIQPSPTGAPTASS